MISFGSMGWQTTIADLSLILFMVAASAVSEEADTAPHAPAAAEQAPHNPLPAMAEPVAIYRPGPATPPLEEWLATQAPDGRQQLTILAHYAGQDPARAADAALQIAASARRAGWQPRIMLEAGRDDDVVALIGYDSAANGAADVAR